MRGGAVGGTVEDDVARRRPADDGVAVAVGDGAAAADAVEASAAGDGRASLHVDDVSRPLPQLDLNDRHDPEGSVRTMTDIDRAPRDAYSVSEVARRLGVSPLTVRRQIAAGKLPSVRIGDRVLVPADYLDRLREEP